jgi:hypothetical protein
MKTAKNKLATAALLGLMGTCLVTATVVHAGEKSASEEKKADKHACKGQNACKGQGADGKNACKGQGSCRTDGKK